MASRFSIALGTLTQAQALLDKIVAQGALSTAQREASGPERWMLYLEGPRGNVARMQNEHQNGQFGAAWCPTRRQGGFIFRVFSFSSHMTQKTLELDHSVHSTFPVFKMR